MILFNIVPQTFPGYGKKRKNLNFVIIHCTKKENIYCYSEDERDKAQKKLGKNCETSRFKGLGEINPSEFRQFIDPQTMHLTPVEVSQLKVIPQLLAFYMGKNTPERRSFIEQHLLSNAEIDV